MDDVKHRELLASIAQDFYLSKLPITDISSKYQLSRYLITKSLDEALGSGLVKISIDAPVSRNLELELSFKQRFNIRNMYILRDTESPDKDSANIIDFAASEVQDLIRHSHTVGMTWGGTVWNIIDHFQTEVRENLVFTQFIGENMKLNTAASTVPLVQKAAAKFDATYLTLPTPLYITNDDVRTQLGNEPALLPTLTAANQMDLLFAGIGTLASVNTIPVWKQHFADLFPGVDENKIAGMLFGRPYDVDGNILVTDDKAMGTDMSHLLAVPRRVGIVKSKFKSRALLGALRGGFLTDVITNEAVANRVLLEMDD
ncbi:sugar-binding transcriptional regulator [Furfurilactobacillus siliginis]|uniref:Citrate lyase n=1 Tax=Furfurilactobacillus siliginis TaxID=348151 RepID=A0A0R2LBZ4_9LACO|nr:sugar-binding domain-containing protein [Furfurilactobacillus siliginis]KRN97238.1 citrate lyase regulator [Furfurilactobacillus siliginis]GEK29458.1 citrate lyase [Furfurilactobacillus siliginis]